MKHKENPVETSRKGCLNGKNALKAKDADFLSTVTSILYGEK